MEQKDLFDAVQSGDVTKVINLVSDLKDVNVEDQHGMTLLQAAAFKGSTELCKLLLDMGADPNGGHHDNNYSSLHFAALSGNPEVCTLLLEAGTKPDCLNSVNRTPAQMAAFIGNHSCVAVINNYVNPSKVDYYTEVHGQEAQPKLDPSVGPFLHKLVNLVNVNPVKIVRYVNENPVLWDHLSSVVKVLSLMSEKEMKRGKDANEILALKFHHFHFVLSVLEKECAQLAVKHTGSDLRQMTIEHFLKSLVKKQTDTRNIKRS